VPSSCRASSGSGEAVATQRLTSCPSGSVGLALDNIRQVLELELDLDDPNYRATLQAKTTMASNVITSALKADDNRLKERQLDNGNMYAELKRRIGEYYAKRGQLPRPGA
jgi:hypothetical protein